MTDTTVSTPKTGGKASLGLLVLIGKLAGKALPKLLKLAKGLKFGQVGLAGASFGAYAVLVSWEFAVLLLGSLFIHEMGHIWAMKRCGLKTKGVYFIPFIGAAAVTEEAFKSRKDETFIALMGPIWGFGLALVAYAAYLVTGAPLAAAVAGWIALLNLFNLLPINPLDGGRVVKSVVHSIDSKTGYAVMAALYVASMLVALKFGLGLVWFLMIIGAFELLNERDRVLRDRDRKITTRVLAELFRCEPHPLAVAAELERQDRAWRQWSPSEKESFVAKVHEFGMRRGWFTEDMRSAMNDFSDPMNCVHFLSRCGFIPVRRTLFLRKPYRPHYALPTFLREREMPAMTAKESALGSAVLILLAGSLIALMYVCSHVPAAETALKMLMS